MYQRKEKERKSCNVIIPRLSFPLKVKIRFTFPLLNGPVLPKCKTDFRNKPGRARHLRPPVTLGLRVGFLDENAKSPAEKLLTVHFYTDTSTNILIISTSCSRKHTRPSKRMRGAASIPPRCPDHTGFRRFSAPRPV